MWFDRQTYLQRMYTDLERFLEDHGWTRYLTYRITDGNTKFIDVRLFESFGSDDEWRRFGIANSYDTAQSGFDDQRYITQDSPLGRLGVGNGTQTDFELQTFPVVPTSLIVYKNNVEVSSSNYTLDNVKGFVKFNTAPLQNEVITCEFKLQPTAPEPNNEMILFTFSKSTIYGVVALGDTGSNLGNGDGTKTSFPLTHQNIDETSISVYKNAVKVPLISYSYDLETNSIVFNEAPTTNDEITVEYKYFDSADADNMIPPVVTSKAWVYEDAESIMNIVYGEARVDYLQPSPYTCVSFTPEEKFTNDWKRDSIMYFYGNANKDRIIMFMRVDPSGAPTRALFVPVYIGKLHTLGIKPRKNMVVLSGARTGDPFRWSKDKTLGGKLVDYGENTSNGNETVQLAQNFSGAMYQHHYLAFITHDKDIDVDGQGRYNPSMYSNKYHLSQIYIVHPNDGYVGKLDDVYAVHPKNIQQADELEITKDVTDEVVGKGDGLETIFHIEHKPVSGTLKLQVNCVDVPETDYTFDVETKKIKFNEPPVGEILADYQFAQLFRYTLPTTAVSPMTQDKATPFNPIGLAIYKEDI